MAEVDHLQTTRLTDPDLGSGSLCIHRRAAQLAYDDLDSFPWATAVMKESLRMWPTVTPQLGLQRYVFLTSRRYCTCRCTHQHCASPPRTAWHQAHVPAQIFVQ